MADKSTLPPKQIYTLRRTAEKYNKRSDEIADIRAELDALVVEARSNGGTFREIASIVGRSVAWVQGSLQRSENKAA